MNSNPNSVVASTAATSTNRGELKLTIKAANQKFSDFVIETFELDWSIRRLKKHLSDNYPKNPEINSMRLIYSGKLLNDDLTLNECIRHNSETKNHIIHLVHSNLTSKSSKGSSKLSPKTVNSNINDVLNQTYDLDIENELTPNTSTVNDETLSDTSSTSSNSELTSPSLSPRPDLFSQSTANINSFNRIQSDLNRLYRQQQHQFQQLSEKEQYNQILNNLIKYYESSGIQVQSSSWYSAYLQQLALYYHMNGNYLKSLSENTGVGIKTQQQQQQQPSSSNIINEAQVTEDQNVHANAQGAAAGGIGAAQAADQQRQRNRPANNNNDIAGEREDDWLGTLHNIVSFLVLFSIIYYYSSMERFLVIFAITIVLILYHNGWLSLQRRIVNVNIRDRQENQQRQDPNENANNNQANRDGNNNNNNNRQAAAAGAATDTADQTRNENTSQNSPNFFRLILTFILTFFTSLIPERPRGIAN